MNCIYIYIVLFSVQNCIQLLLTCLAIMATRNPIHHDDCGVKNAAATEAKRDLVFATLTQEGGNAVPVLVTWVDTPHNFVVSMFHEVLLFCCCWWWCCCCFSCFMSVIFIFLI